MSNHSNFHDLAVTSSGMRVEVPRDLFRESAPVYRLVVATVDSPLRECLVPVNRDCLCRDTVGPCNDKSDFELSFRIG